MNGNFVFRGFIIALFAGNAVFSAGCPASNPQNSLNESLTNVNRQSNMQNSPENKDVINSDIDELAKNINLPVRPIEAVWTKKTLGNPESRVPGPTDYLLVAVLKYDDAGIETLKAKIVQSDTVKGVAEIQGWFPADLKNLARDFDNEKLLSGEKYDAKSFARPPYLNGTLLRVNGSNYFVLTLFST